MKTLKLISILVLILSSIFIKQLAAQGNPESKENKVLSLGINETYSGVRNGIRLILSYNHSTSAFVGTAENITLEILKSVSIRVLLSSGSSLGPIFLTDLAAGETKKVILSDKGQMFNWWMTHITTGGEIHESAYGEKSTEDLHKGERSTEDLHKGERSGDNTK